ncbi:hypothetical protein Pan97_48220 [Bremerella volcania]|uniref:Uncharacterized protein n=1 Tax=Bremerella volcania TaxID=2527984 RepID=A0A518CET8_9BACT|nr:hypothetical protein Pan97_48220 [Bremerella volcania]
MILKIPGNFVNGLGLGFRTFFEWLSQTKRKPLFSGGKRLFLRVVPKDDTWNNLSDS